MPSDILCHNNEPHSYLLGEGGRGEWRAAYLFAGPATYIQKDGTGSQLVGRLTAAMWL